MDDVRFFRDFFEERELRMSSVRRLELGGVFGEFMVGLCPGLVELYCEDGFTPPGSGRRDWRVLLLEAAAEIPTLKALTLDAGTDGWSVELVNGKFC